jgi:citrate lyase subunit beta/citryl-CoA lyase
MIEGVDVAGLVIPKADNIPDLREVRRYAARARRKQLLVLAGIETALGVTEVVKVARSGTVDALYFGAEDYITELGGRRTPGGDEVLYARSQVVLAAAIAGLPAIDQAVIAYTDDDAFTRDAERGRDLGYRGKLCIHPRQVQLAHHAFTPSEQEVAVASRVVAAADTGTRTGNGVATVDGRMIDAPLLARARRILNQAS